MDDDFPFLFPGKPVSKAALQQRLDQIDRQRGAVSILEYITDREDRDAIKAGTSLADLTPIFDLATQQIHDSGGGTLFLPSGLYHGTIRLTREGVSQCNITGEYGGTVLRAPADGEFAIVFAPFSEATPSGMFPLIENLQIDGQNPLLPWSIRHRRRCGICAPMWFNMNNVSFNHCLIGAVSMDNYFGHWSNLNVWRCDVGLLFGTFGDAERRITNLRQGYDILHLHFEQSEEISVDLPTVANSRNGHSGNKLLTHYRSNGCRISLVMEGRTFVPRMLLVKPTVESGHVGILNLSGHVDIYSAWFESMHNSGEDTFNGHKFKRGAAVYAAAEADEGLYERYGARVRMMGDNRLERIRTGTGGQIVVDQASDFGLDPDIGHGSSVVLTNIETDNRHIAHLVRRPTIMYESFRGIACYVPTKDVKRWSQPNDGRVLISDDCQGQYFFSRYCLIEAQSGIKWGEEGGLFAEQKCLRIMPRNEFRINLDIMERIYPGEFYCIAFNVMADGIASVSLSHINGFHFVLANGPLPLKSGSWTTVWISAQNQINLPHNPFIRFSEIEKETSFLLSGIQVIVTGTRASATQIAEEPFFYTKEVFS